MKKKNSRFSVNYILIGILVVLLIFLKRMDDRISELEKRETVVEKVELKKGEKARATKNTKNAKNQKSANKVPWQ